LPPRSTAEVALIAVRMYDAIKCSLPPIGSDPRTDPRLRFYTVNRLILGDCGTQAIPSTAVDDCRDGDLCRQNKVSLDFKVHSGIATGSIGSPIYLLQPRQ
jgi:hypothetical protein